MGTLHLTKGSPKPPPQEPGTLRLYSMKFCPYAHRVRLVLRAKRLPHDIVNVNMIIKPDWITEINLQCKVPALDTGTEILVESLNIVRHLERTYSEFPLYRDETTDDQIISKIDPLGALFYRCVFKKEVRSPNEWLDEFAPHLDYFERELANRGTTLYGGNEPGMVDYMLWPWAERAGVVTIALGERLPVTKEKYPKLKKWYRSMRQNSVVDALYITPERHYKTVLFSTENIEPDYDAV